MIHHSSSTAAAPLPTTIAVRNLFPPLAISTVAAVAEPGNESFHRETETCNERLDDNNNDGNSQTGGNHDGTDIAEYDDNSNDLFDIERDSAIERELNEIKEILAEAEKGSKAETDFSSDDYNDVDESDESSSGIAHDDNCNLDSYDDGDHSESEILLDNIKPIATNATLGKHNVLLDIEDRCAFVSQEVLLPLRLEIVWKKGKEQREETLHSEDGDTCETNEGKKVPLERDANEEQTIHVIYSNTMSYCTTHPRWDHLNEQLTKTSISTILEMHQSEGGSVNAVSNCNKSNPSSPMSEAAVTPAGATTKFNEPITSSSDTESFKWQNVYSDIYARIIVLPISQKSTDGETTGELNERILAEIPLHPSKLQSLSGPNDSLGTFGDDEGTRNESGNNMTTPSSLPPNAILIHYTDGHTRVLPDLFELLIKKEIIGGDSASAAVARGAELVGVNDQNKFVDSRRFSDKAFDVLGTSAGEDKRDGDDLVAWKDDRDEDDGDSNLLDGRAMKNATDSIYDNDKVFDLLGKDEDGPASGDVSLLNSTKKDSGTASNSVFDDRAFDLMEESAQVDDHDVDGIAATIASSSISKEIATEQPTRNENGYHDSKILLSPDGGVDMMHDQKVESSVLANAVESFGLRLDPASTVDKSSSPSTSPPHTPPPSSTKLSPTSTILPPLPPLPTSLEVRSPSQKLLRVHGEVDELRRLVQREQMLLEKEQQLIVEETNRLKAIMSQVEQLHGENEGINRASSIERVHIFRSNFRLEAHRISLLQQLQNVFPIKLIPIDIPHNISSFASTANVSNTNRTVHQYTIAGVPLPNDVHSPSVSDDQVSAALGFTCHLVALTSKYLGISLRYPIVCKFSRSAILDNEQRRIISGNGNRHKTTYAVYPLFRERVVEREQLDRGCELLNRNVECLLKMRNVEFRKDWNVLAKIDCLMMQLVEGEDIAFAASR